MDLVLIRVKAVDMAYSRTKKVLTPLEIIMGAIESLLLKERLCVGSPAIYSSRIRARRVPF